MNRFIASLLLFCAILLFAPLAASAVTIQWSPVNNPGNPAIAAGSNLVGSVAYAYKIGAYEVTNSQYVEFLNTKDPTGANSLGLYNSRMSTSAFSGIDFNSGAANGNKFNVKSGQGNYPVNVVTWFNAIRFTNWLNNGQGSGDTETGAYTLLGGTPKPSNSLNIVRNSGATVFLPSRDEWHKAAFYNPSTNSYYRFPTSSDTTPTAAAPTSAPNSANYLNAVGNLTEVGAYSGTTSPYGAFDMAGNVWEWTELLTSLAGDFRHVLGGDFTSNASAMFVANASFVQETSGNFNGLDGIGFRVAMVPEPSSFVLAALGLIGLVVWRRRKR